MFLPAWLIFSILTGVASNAFNYFARYILRGKYDPVVFLWYTEFAKLAVFLPAAFLFDWKLDITLLSIIILLLTGFTQLIGGYYWVKMHEHSDLSISAIITRTRLIWVPIFAFFFLGERLTSWDYIGIVILFIGVSIISAPHKLFVDKGATYANACAILTAINIIITKMALPYASNSVLIAFHALPPVLLLPLLMKDTRIRMKQITSNNFKLMSGVVLINVFSFLFFALAIRVGDASKVNAVYQGMLFLSVLAGIILLKEREDIPKKIIGTIVSVVGVVLLSIQ